MTALEIPCFFQLTLDCNYLAFAHLPLGQLFLQSILNLSPLFLWLLLENLLFLTLSE